MEMRNCPHCGGILFTPKQSGRKAQCLLGKVFGYWSVIERTKQPEHLRTNSGTTYWLCRCTCGTTKVVAGVDLVKGRSKSCGCAKTYWQKKTFRKNHPNFRRRLPLDESTDFLLGTDDDSSIMDAVAAQLL
jgi:hypothetical protein